MLIATQLVGFGASAIGVELSLTAQANSGTDGTSFTFAGLSLGDPSASRRIIVAVAHNRNPAQTISTVTVGGVSATIVTNVNSANFLGAGLAIADVPTGTTGDVVVTFANTALQCAVAVYRVVNLASSTAHATALQSGATAGVLSTTINVPSGGLAVAMAINSVPAAYTWSAGLLEDTDQTVEGQITGSSASSVFAAAQTGLTITTSAGSGTNAVLTVASWG